MKADHSVIRKTLLIASGLGLSMLLLGSAAEAAPKGPKGGPKTGSCEVGALVCHVAVNNNGKVTVNPICDEEEAGDHAPGAHGGDFLLTFYADNDGDRFGAGAASFGCAVPAGSVENDLDCDDDDPAINPDAEDSVCNGVDDDCDGTPDGGYERDESCFLPGECSASNAASTCNAGNETACQTGTPTAEACDGLDNDCNGAIDEGLGTITCGIGECQSTVVACADGQPVPCEPSDATDEVCNGLDNDCDGIIDNKDDDDDTYVDLACDGGTDCNDDEPAINVGATELCSDGLDNNCNGDIDADGAVCAILQPTSIIALSPQAGATLNPGDPVDVDFFLLVDASVEGTIKGVQVKLDLGSQFSNAQFEQVADSFPWNLISQIGADPANPTSGALSVQEANPAAPLFVGDGSGVLEIAAASSPKYVFVSPTVGGIHIGSVHGFAAGGAGGEIIVSILGVNGLSSFCRNGLIPDTCLIDNESIATGVFIAAP
jgi:hypothetical protein